MAGSSGMITRDNDFVFETTYHTIDSSFIIERINSFCRTITKLTVIVPDNAKVHRSESIKAMQKVWANKNLFLFYLPPYSPQLNIIERLWKELKERWIQADCYQTKLIPHEIGNSFTLNFKKYCPNNFA